MNFAAITILQVGLAFLDQNTNVPALESTSAGTQTTRNTSVELAQSVECANRYTRLQAELESYYRQCSKSFTQSQYDECKDWYVRLISEVESYNSQC